jgi:hypothetical protein
MAEFSPQPRTIEEFTDRMAWQREELPRAIDRVLPDDLAELVHGTGERTRGVLGLPEDQLIVFFGEQTYGPGPQKVAAKRLLGHAARLHAGATSVEFMASSDAIGSEPYLRSFELPNSQTPAGFTSINLLPGWKHTPHRAARATHSPSPEHVEKIAGTVRNIYDRGMATAFLDRLAEAYGTHP